MAKVQVTIGLAGNGFAYSANQIVDQDVFSAKVGSGWERLCVPYEAAVEDDADETADARPVVETAVLRPVTEVATKRRKKNA